MSKDKHKNKEVNDADFSDLLNDLKDLATIPKELDQNMTKPTTSTSSKLIHENRNISFDDNAVMISHIPYDNKNTPKSTKSRSRSRSFADFKVMVRTSQQENTFNYDESPSRSNSTSKRKRSSSMSLPSKKHDAQNIL